MTETELDAIRARCNTATPGPWEVINGSEFIIVDSDGTVACTYKGGQSDNGKFIAAARQDIPALLEHIDRLTRERDAAIKDARDNAHNPCIICARYQANRYCDLRDDPNGENCGGFWRWIWRELEEEWSE